MDTLAYILISLVIGYVIGYWIRSRIIDLDHELDIADMRWEIRRAEQHAAQLISDCDFMEAALRGRDAAYRLKQHKESAR
jgi:hypothetical protein